MSSDRARDAADAVDPGNREDREDRAVFDVYIQGTSDDPAVRTADPAAVAPDRATVEHLDGADVIDATKLPPGQRHPLIFARYAALASGESFILSNTHDPKPLHREFEAAHSGAFTWDYVESGPHRWQVRIGKVDS